MSTNKKVIFPLLLSFVVIFSLYKSVAALTGGWSPITHVKDPHIVKIGEFAVDEYDKENELILQFVKVVKGETQVVSDGTNYRLVLEVNDYTTRNKNAEAIVLEKPLLKSFTLTSFKFIVSNDRFL